MTAELIENGVIVADNDYLIRGILRSILEESGLHVFLACDGAEAMEFARRIVVRLVILDLNMPKLNGFCACEQLRLLPGYAAVPIVILSAYGDLAARKAAERAGATRFFAKPFTPVDLLAGIVPLLGLEVGQDTPPPPAKSPQLVWTRHAEPTPLYGEPAELSAGRRVLSVYRR